jgi:hypothetical protein
MRITDRLAVLSLCISAALALGILVAALSVRTRDLERLHRQDAIELAEMAVLHEAVCNLRSGYSQRQALFGQFLTGRPFPYGPSRQLVIALRGSFAETLFALRSINCGPTRPRGP